MPAINPLPTPPSRNDPANFSDRADAFLAALPAYTSEANALLDDVHTSRDTVQTLRNEVIAAGLESAAANAATAATKAAEAASSASEAFGYLQAYRATSYGALAADPVVDPNGNPPTVGDEYFNTSMNLLKRFNGVTWQASDIATANLAAPGGSALVGYDGGTAQDVLDDAKPMANYTAMRAYTGRATGVRITQTGLEGFFKRDDADTTSADNGGTVIVDGAGRRWKRLHDTAVSVKWFGAVGDGITDDTNAIKAAVAYAKATALVKCITFPTGNYKVSDTIQVHGNFNQGVELRGDKATITSTANAPIFSIQPRGTDSPPEVRINAYVHGFILVGPGKANTSSVALYAGRGANVRVRECTLKGCYRGLYLFGNLISSYDNLVIHQNFYGIDIEPDAIEFNPNDIHFTNCQVFDNDRCVRATTFPNGAITFIGCELEGNNLAGNTTDTVKVVEFSNAGKVTLIGCHMEENPGQYNLYYAGANANCQLNLIGSDMIPGDSCGTVLYVASGSVSINGTRVTNNFGSSQVTLATGVSAFVVGETAGGFGGDTSKLFRFIAGILSVGGVRGDVCGIRSKSASGIGYDCEGQFRFVDAANNRLGYQTSSTLVLDASDQYRIVTGRGTLGFTRLAGVGPEPGSDNALSLGSAALRWSTVYAATGTINTSDARAKQQVRELDDAERAVAVRLKSLVRAFKFNDAVESKGDGARIHVGVIAQDVKSAFEAEGLIAEDYAILCHDVWDDIVEDVVDDHGKPTGETAVKTPAGDRYGVRYEELLAFIVSAL